ncbi:hypothetical protein FOZ62_020573, partial [Perkinsus olseni]
TIPTVGSPSRTTSATSATSGPSSNGGRGRRRQYGRNWHQQPQQQQQQQQQCNDNNASGIAVSQSSETPSTAESPAAGRKDPQERPYYSFLSTTFSQVVKTHLECGVAPGGQQQAAVPVDYSQLVDFLVGCYCSEPKATLNQRSEEKNQESLNDKDRALVEAE